MGAGEGHAVSGNPLPPWVQRSQGTPQRDGRGRLDGGTVGAWKNPVLLGLHLELVFLRQAASVFVCPGSPFFQVVLHHFGAK